MMAMMIAMSATTSNRVRPPGPGSARSSSVAYLIRVTRKRPDKPVVAGLLHKNEILLLHGSAL
jgi:hypothetical protein